MSIGLKLLQAHSPKVVIYGMSCVGKTTMARLMVEHKYLCFDGLFDWHLVETLGLSIEVNLRHVASICDSNPKFVLDGWHLADKQCELIPNATAYVLYDAYHSIISRYRVPVANPEEHRVMYQKWYDLRLAVPVRYFRNQGDFIETSEQDFTSLARSQGIECPSGIQGSCSSSCCE